MGATTDRRVLWLTASFPPGRGGMAQSCDRLVRGLRATGVEVDVAHFTHRPGRWEIREQHGGRCWICPLDGDPPHAMNRLWAALAGAGPFTHVVAFGGPLPLVAGPVYAAWLGAPLVTLLRGNDFDVAVFSPARREALSRAIEASAVVCAVAESTADRVRALWPGRRVRCIHNGIDLERWAPLASDRDAAAAWRAAHVEPGRRTVGLFGHLKRKKGARFLLDVVRRSGLADRLHLVLVGDLEPAVAEWLETHDDVAVTWLPFQDRHDLLRLYPACDLVAVPSFYDGLPNVVLEAAALGIPLLASTAGGMGDVLVDGEHGFLFHPGDPHGCRLALHRAVTAGDDDLAAMGARARALVEARLGHRREIAAYVEVLDETRTGL